MRKGQANLIEYLFTILFSVIIIASITAIVYTFYLKSITAESRESMRQLAIEVSNKVVDVYNTAKNIKNIPENSTSVMIFETDLKFPPKISRRNYEVVIISGSITWSGIRSINIGGKEANPLISTPGAKVIVSMTQDPKESIEHDIPNVDVIVQGRSENGINSTLRYYRYNLNGTLYDTVILGGSDIIVNIDSIG
jgi:hypothetical protein